MTSATWRDAYDAGVRRATARQLDLPHLTGIAFELTALRVAYSALCAEVARRDRIVAAVTRSRVKALRRVVELARLLDQLAPGWDTAASQYRGAA